MNVGGRNSKTLPQNTYNYHLGHKCHQKSKMHCEWKQKPFGIQIKSEHALTKQQIYSENSYCLCYL